jgi:ribokinase
VTSVAVIGHVEWVTNALSREMVRPGAIVHLHDAFEEPGAGGGVAARVLPSLGATETRFYTALADDEAGRRSAEIMAAEGVDVRAARRPGAQNRVTTVIDPSGERLIMLHGRNTHPRIDDPLPWDELERFDAVFYTGDDPATLVAARRARVLVCTARRFDSLVRSGVRADVLIGSAREPAEQVDVSRLAQRPEVVAQTLGAEGGEYVLADGTRGSWQAAPLDGPPVDAYGAGDAFMAGLALALGRGDGLDAALAFAARAGAAQLLRRGGGPPGAQ